MKKKIPNWRVLYKVELYCATNMRAKDKFDAYDKCQELTSQRQLKDTTVKKVHYLGMLKAKGSDRPKRIKKRAKANKIKSRRKRNRHKSSNT